jgi:signal transduction histidine kinase
MDANQEMTALIETLLQTGRRLEELTAGQVDTVADREGRTLLLRGTQEQLRQSEVSRQAAILNALAAPVALLDTKGIILSVNDAWRRFASAQMIQGPGYEVGLNYLDFCESTRGDGSSEAHLIAKGIRSVLGGMDKSFSIEYPCPSPKEQLWFLLTVTPLTDDRRNGAVVMHVNISERKKLEEQLRTAHKMEAVGQLAGGVAHDFNNLIGVIIGYGELIQDKLLDADPLHAKVEEVLKAGRRAAALTHQLLVFSRQQVLEPKTLNLNSIVTDMNKMLPRLVGEHIELTTSLARDLASIRADQGHIEQVIMNLAVNARDAMPEGGKLTIETANVEFDEHYALGHNQVLPGSFIMLAVTDTGVGMDAGTQSRIFEPFFTTKEQGKGTGLGLATVYGAVKQSGGFVWVYSEPGHGTTFKIYLPRVKGEAETELGNIRSKKLVRGTETVLLVEDEESLNKLTGEMLQEGGYCVLKASNGVEALEISQRYEGTIHLLLTDVVMPKMGGPALAKQLGVLRPEMKLLYMSGYTRNALVTQELAESGSGLLQKPFTRDTLTRKAREILDTLR